jgi:polyhydroxyalkanoate synthesis regulator phasin
MARNNGTQTSTDNQLTRLVRGSANQVWHAGRGAYSLAGTQSGRLVGGLMDLGGRLDREAKSRVFEARTSATEAWERLESAFVHRVGRALNALQIPTARDVKELTARVEALQKAVVALERRAAQVPPARKTRAPRKKAGPRAVRKAPVRARSKAGA